MVRPAKILFFAKNTRHGPAFDKAGRRSVSPWAEALASQTKPLKVGEVLGAALPAVVETGGRNIVVSDPFLDLGKISRMFQGIPTATN
jgi:hypothetical protein